MQIIHAAIGGDRCSHRYRALVLGFSGLVGVLGLRSVEAVRVAHAADAGPIRSAPGAAARARPQSAARTATDASPRPTADAAASTGPTRGGEKLGQRITIVIHVRAGNFQV